MNSPRNWITSHKRVALVALLVLTMLAVPLSFADFGDLVHSWTSSEISSILNKALSVKDKSNAINGKTGGVKDVVKIANTAFSSLSPRVLDAVESGRLTATADVKDEMTGARDFVGQDNCGPMSQCDQFRTNIITLLDRFTDVVNSLIAIDDSTAALGLQLQLSRTRSAIQTAPGIALYPIYLGMTRTGDLLGGLLDTTAKIKGNLVIAQALLASTAPASLTVSSPSTSLSLPGYDSCDYMLSVPNVGRAVSVGLLSYAVELKLIAKTLQALGETLVLGGPKDAGIHGYFEIDFHDNQKKMLGTYIDSIADILSKISVYLDNKLIYCAALGQQADVLAALQGTIFPANRRRP